MLAIQVPVCSTLGAFHLLARLPKCVAGVALVRLIVGLVDAWALDEGVEGTFIDTLVDIGATNQGFEVACGLRKVALTRRWVFRLLIQEAFDLLNPGQLLGKWLRRLGSSGSCIQLHLWAIFIQTGLQDFCRETLVHPDTAAAALIATPWMWLPVVVVGIPRFATAVHQLLFVLLGQFALVPGGLLVHVVHVVGKDLAESIYSMLINQLVILI